MIIHARYREHPPGDWDSRPPQWAHAIVSVRGVKFKIQHTKLQQGVVTDTYDSLIYRGYGGDDALRAVATIPPATHKMS